MMDRSSYFDQNQTILYNVEKFDFLNQRLCGQNI